MTTPTDLRALAVEIAEAVAAASTLRNQERRLAAYVMGRKRYVRLGGAASGR